MGAIVLLFYIIPGLVGPAIPPTGHEPQEPVGDRRVSGNISGRSEHGPFRSVHLFISHFVFQPSSPAKMARRRGCLLLLTVVVFILATAFLVNRSRWRPVGGTCTQQATWPSSCHSRAFRRTPRPRNDLLFAVPEIQSMDRACDLRDMVHRVHNYALVLFASPFSALHLDGRAETMQGKLLGEGGGLRKIPQRHRGRGFLEVTAKKTSALWKSTEKAKGKRAECENIGHHLRRSTYRCRIFH